MAVLVLSLTAPLYSPGHLPPPTHTPTHTNPYHPRPLYFPLHKGLTFICLFIAQFLMTMWILPFIYCFSHLFTVWCFSLQLWFTKCPLEPAVLILLLQIWPDFLPCHRFHKWQINSMDSLDFIFLKLDNPHFSLSFCSLRNFCGRRQGWDVLRE